MSARAKQFPEAEAAPGVPQIGPAIAAAAPAPAPAPRRRRRWLLIAALPVALAIGGGVMWWTGGRYVTTEDAYVQQDKITIVPEVAGRIVEAGVGENQHVEPGDLLFRVDESAYAVSVHEAEAAVASARLDVERLKAAYVKAVSDRQAANQTLTFAQDTFRRQQSLAESGVVAQSALDKAQLDLQQAEAAVAAAEQAVLSAVAALAGDPDIATDTHPEVMEAQAKLERARLDLDHTRIVAPAAGTISQTDRLHVGQYVMPGTAVLSLVETGESWIEANFKETEVTHMSAGQPVSVAIDTYPGRSFEGRLESLGAGTGAEFSLLPAQNATGNWVKVVQRIPVRVVLDPVPDMPALRTGMSASVTVDTGVGGMAAFGAEPDG